MTVYNEGDLVEAVKGTDVRRGLVTTPPSHEHAKMQAKCLHNYESEGWTLTVIEKAAPKNVLPIETGWYLDRYHRAFHFTPSSQLFWWGNSEPVKDASHLIGPFTRLEPVPVTAKKVIERFEKLHLNDNMWLDDVAVISAEFGVSQ